MARKPSPKWASGELEILELLWRDGPATLAQAHARLGRGAYTTMQTRLNRLVAKKAIRRSTDRPAVYEAAISPPDAASGHLAMLVQRVAQGSVVPLVAQLVSERKLSAAEVAELKALVAEAEAIQQAQAIHDLKGSKR
jgi:predicted transcriptional regulator